MTALSSPSPDAPPTPITFDDIVEAAERIRDAAVRTPVLASPAIDALVGAEVRFKCENFQRIGAFKFRGAYSAMTLLDDDQRHAGVLTYSSGNHAQAIARSAALLGLTAVIVMPEDAPRIKLEAARRILLDAAPGSEVITYDPATAVREELGAELERERGLTLIPPFDHPHVIAGQGTAAMELIEDEGPFDAIIGPVGGGGFISGSSIAAKAMLPGCEVFGVEPELGDDATRSFRTRTLQTVRNPRTIADGARTSSLGRYTFPLVLANVDDMMTVSDAEIARAMRLLIDTLKIMVEPTGAMATAGLIRLAHEAPDRVAGRRIGVLVSGGNFDLDKMDAILELARA